MYYKNGQENFNYFFEKQVKFYLINRFFFITGCGVCDDIHEKTMFSSFFLCMSLISNVTESCFHHGQLKIAPFLHCRVISPNGIRYTMKSHENCGYSNHVKGSMHSFR